MRRYDRRKSKKKNLARRVRRQGLTLEQHQAMYDLQGGLCAICYKGKRLVIDHCHKTDVVRGLLCGNCNTGIGLLGESKENLLTAIAYLSKFPT